MPEIAVPVVVCVVCCPPSNWTIRAIRPVLSHSLNVAREQAAEAGAATTTDKAKAIPATIPNFFVLIFVLFTNNASFVDHYVPFPVTLLCPIGQNRMTGIRKQTTLSMRHPFSRFILKVVSPEDEPLKNDIAEISSYSPLSHLFFIRLNGQRTNASDFQTTPLRAGSGR